MKVAHIDADLAVYAVASACDGKKYKYRGELYDLKKDLNPVLKADGVDDSAVEVVWFPEVQEKVKESTISYMEGIITKVDMDYKLYLSGKSNFRYALATIKPYKGNRTLTEKPVHFDFVRQLYKDLYDAVIAPGIEADDAIGLATESDDVIVTRDKDLNCIPGMHYDWVTDIHNDISLLEADKCFYKQVLTGDDTDNILGLFGVGKDSKLLKILDSMENDVDMFNFVKNEYIKRFGKHWRLFLRENMELLWILQKRKPIWKEWLIDDTI